jgi:hypothetical protein
MLLLAAAAIIAATQPVPPAKPTKCEQIDSYIVAREGPHDGRPPALRKLTDLPPANMYVAVLRHDERGCLAPIVVKYDLGR